MSLDNQIEIYTDVKASVGVRFWVDAGEWRALSSPQRAAKIEAAIDSLQNQLNRADVQSEFAYLSVEIGDAVGEVTRYCPQTGFYETEPQPEKE